MKKKIHTNIEIQDAGAVVVCDACCDDWTHRTESGGFLFLSYAYCPDCAKSSIEQIRRYGEEKYIRAWCPTGKSFARWVLDDLRKGNNEMRIITKELR